MIYENRFSFFFLGEQNRYYLNANTEYIIWIKKELSDIYDDYDGECNLSQGIFLLL